MYHEWKKLYDALSPRDRKIYDLARKATNALGFAIQNAHSDYSVCRYEGQSEAAMNELWELLTKGDTMNIEDAARLAHEVNRAYVYATTNLQEPHWEDAPAWQKDSAINGIKMHWDAHDQGNLVHPWDSHESWLKQKKEEGWKYGPVKDPAKKEHPCFVPYNEASKTKKAAAHISLILVAGFFWIYSLIHHDDAVFLVCSGCLAIQLFCAYKDLFGGGDDGENSGPGSFDIPAPQH